MNTSTSNIDKLAERVFEKVNERVIERVVEKVIERVEERLVRCIEEKVIEKIIQNLDKDDNSTNIPNENRDEQMIRLIGCKSHFKPLDNNAHKSLDVIPSYAKTEELQDLSKDKDASSSSKQIHFTKSTNATYDFTPTKNFLLFPLNNKKTSIWVQDISSNTIKYNSTKIIEDISSNSVEEKSPFYIQNVNSQNSLLAINEEKIESCKLFYEKPYKPLQDDDYNKLNVVSYTYMKEKDVNKENSLTLLEPEKSYIKTDKENICVYRSFSSINKV